MLPVKPADNSPVGLWEETSSPPSLQKQPPRPWVFGRLPRGPKLKSARRGRTHMVKGADSVRQRQKASTASPSCKRADRQASKPGRQAGRSQSTWQCRPYPPAHILPSRSTEMPCADTPTDRLVYLCAIYGQIRCWVCAIRAFSAPARPTFRVMLPFPSQEKTNSVERNARAGIRSQRQSDDEDATNGLGRGSNLTCSEACPAWPTIPSSPSSCMWCFP